MKSRGKIPWLFLYNLAIGALAGAGIACILKDLLS